MTPDKVKDGSKIVVHPPLDTKNLRIHLHSNEAAHRHDKPHHLARPPKANLATMIEPSIEYFYTLYFIPIAILVFCSAALCWMINTSSKRNKLGSAGGQRNQPLGLSIVRKFCWALYYLCSPFTLLLKGGTKDNSIRYHE